MNCAGADALGILADLRGDRPQNESGRWQGPRHCLRSSRRRSCECSADRRDGSVPARAVAVDPKTGIVYLTEDNGSNSGFYRFLPQNRQPEHGALEKGGRLEMLHVAGTPNADLRAPSAGDVHAVDWVPIAEPDSDPEGFARRGSVVMSSASESQGRTCRAKPPVAPARGEGAWWHGDLIYWVDTSAGAAGAGAVWTFQ